MREQGFVHLLLVVIIILTIGIIGFLSYQNIQGKKIENKTTISESGIAKNFSQDEKNHDVALNNSMINYRDDILGITFNHPVDWRVLSGWDKEGDSQGRWWVINIEKPGMFFMNILQDDNHDKLSPKEWFNNEKGNYNEYFQEISTIVISNNDAYIIATPDFCKSTPVFVVFIKNDKKMLTINYFELASRNEALDLEQLLENFHFLDNTNMDRNIIPSLQFPLPPQDIICEN